MVKKNHVNYEVAKAIFKYQVIAEENNAGRHVILTGTFNECRQLEKEINAGVYAGCLMAAELKATIIGYQTATA